jgi:hypothetical protein
MTPLPHTNVSFFIEKDSDNEVFAFFPDEKMSYAHIGQHSACSIEYVNECKPATREQYEPLAQELRSIGYELNII